MSAGYEGGPQTADEGLNQQKGRLNISTRSAPSAAIQNKMPYTENYRNFDGSNDPQRKDLMTLTVTHAKDGADIIDLKQVGPTVKEGGSYVASQAVGAPNNFTVLPDGTRDHPIPPQKLVSYLRSI